MNRKMNTNDSGLAIINGNDQKAVRQYSPKLTTDLVKDQNGSWIPVGVTDGKFQPYTTYARLSN
jgi:topoisomerase IA-like protein